MNLIDASLYPNSDIRYEKKDEIIIYPSLENLLLSNDSSEIQNILYSSKLMLRSFINGLETTEKAHIVENYLKNSIKVIHGDQFRRSELHIVLKFVKRTEIVNFINFLRYRSIDVDNMKLLNRVVYGGGK